MVDGVSPTQSTAKRGSPQGRLEPRLERLRALRIVDDISLQVAPSLALGAVVFTHSQRGAEALVAAAGSLVAGHLLSRSAYAPHLLTFARVVLRAVAPVIGAAAAAIIALLEGRDAMLGTLGIALFASWLALAVGFGVKRRFESDRPIRVAVLSPGIAAGLADEISVAGIHSHEVIGWVEAPGQAFADAFLAGSRQRLGHLDDIREVVAEHGVDLLVSCPVHGADRARLRVLETVADGCLDQPVRLLELSQLYEDLLGHVPLGATDASWFQYLLNPRFNPGSALAKRAMDLVLGSIALVLAAPVIALFALLVKLTDRAAVFYRQERIGLGRAPFTMLKLRSMTVGAGSRNHWTAESDQRVTRVGEVMRRTHIDELPQLWNVLRGEMSLVGPRPERPELIPALEAQFSYYHFRYLLKPGITGWGQVRCGYAGSETGSAWKLCHDLFYLKHRSALSDLLIMVETFRTVASGAQYGLRAPDEIFLAETEGLAEDAATLRV